MEWNVRHRINNCFYYTVQVWYLLFRSKIVIKHTRWNCSQIRVYLPALGKIMRTFMISLLGRILALIHHCTCKGTSQVSVLNWGYILSGTPWIKEKCRGINSGAVLTRLLIHRPLKNYIELYISISLGGLFAYSDYNFILVPDHQQSKFYTDSQKLMCSSSVYIYHKSVFY